MTKPWRADFLMWHYRLALIPEILNGVDGIETCAPIMLDEESGVDEFLQKHMYGLLLACPTISPDVRKALVEACGDKYRKWVDDQRRRHTEQVDHLITETAQALKGQINPKTSKLYARKEIDAERKQIREAARVSTANALKQRRYRINKKKKLSESVT